MLARRLIPVLFLMDGQMVRSEAFQTHNIIGNPVEHVRRMVEWDVDELIVIDISRSLENGWQISRDDLRYRPPTTMKEFIQIISVECRIPLTFGGRIRSLRDAEERIQNGADKITVNSILSQNPDIVEQIAQRLGSQALVCSCDYRFNSSGQAFIFVENGITPTGVSLLDWVHNAINLGVGEILLQNIGCDGNAQGYDIEQINSICNKVKVPVIACSGAGHQRHFLQCFEETA